MENSDKTTILTGATGGLGHAFLAELCKRPYKEIWAFGRNADKLKRLTEEFGGKVIPFELDLAENGGLERFKSILEERAPDIGLVINNAGVAVMKPSKDLSPEDADGMIALNCRAPVTITNMCLAYMRKGSKVINLSSASAFQPVPYLNLYASSKVFLRNYSRALNAELKPLGISVTAVCPYWIDTDLLTKVKDANGVNFKGVLKPEKVAKKALKDAKKGKDTSVYGLHVKLLHFFTKLLPQRLTMKIWLHMIRKSI